MGRRSPGVWHDWWMGLGGQAIGWGRTGPKLGEGTSEGRGPSWPFAERPGGSAWPSRSPAGPPAILKVPDISTRSISSLSHPGPSPPSSLNPFPVPSFSLSPHPPPTSLCSLQPGPFPSLQTLAHAPPLPSSCSGAAARSSSNGPETLNGVKSFCLREALEFLRTYRFPLPRPCIAAAVA